MKTNTWLAILACEIAFLIFAIILVGIAGVAFPFHVIIDSSPKQQISRQESDNAGVAYSYTGWINFTNDNSTNSQNLTIGGNPAEWVDGSVIYSTCSKNETPYCRICNSNSSNFCCCY